MTDNEIIKALGCCEVGKDKYKKCPLYCTVPACSRNLAENALDLINRQKAEIERLEKTIRHLEDAYNGAGDIAKSEAIKEFVGQLKDRVVSKYEYITVGIFDEIDNLVKEMTEGDKQ